MASSSALQTSFTLPLGIKTSKQPSNENHLAAVGTGRIFNSTSRRFRVVSTAAGGGEWTQKKEKAAPEAPGVDTRIHWDDPDEGWIGGGNNTNDNGKSKNAKESRTNRFESFSDLLNDLSDSHYQFLGVPAEADMEEIKTAYRRLSKEYHPDTTSLPLKTASENFMRLREIYDVLSDQEKRKFYDWTLAQEAASTRPRR